MTVSITCWVCGRTSWNPEDVRYGYCGACHDTTAPTPCPTCQGDRRETVGMVCPRCGRDYAAGTSGR